jgi:hypothetical protein
MTVLHGSAGDCAEAAPSLCSGDADGLRASNFKHPVEGMNCDVDLGPAPGFRPGAQRVTDHPFEAADSGLYQSPTSVPGLLLPADASMLRDALEMPIAGSERSPPYHSAPPLIAAGR